MDSLSHECTAPKHRYDQCFNAWFEGYLKPIVSAHSDDAGSEPDVDEQEDEGPDSDLCDEDDEELVIEEEGSELPLDTEASQSALGSQQNHHQPHHHPHHHPSWSLRNEDRHPDLWPWSSRTGGSKPSTARTVKPLAVAQLSQEPLESLDSSRETEATGDDGALSLSKTSAKASNQQQVPSAIPLTTSSPIEQRAEWAKAKKEEYDRNCGALWTDYRECLQRAIDANHPLSALLNQARLENPIENAEAYEDGGYGAPDAQP